MGRNYNHDLRQDFFETVFREFYLREKKKTDEEKRGEKFAAQGRKNQGRSGLMGNQRTWGTSFTGWGGLCHTISYTGIFLDGKGGLFRGTTHLAVIEKESERDENPASHWKDA